MDTASRSTHPWNQEDIVKGSDAFQEFESTVVTAYFHIPSKRPRSFYEEYMELMLEINDAMVIFTQPDMVGFITERRANKMDRTVIIPIPDFSLSVQIMPYLSEEEEESFWADQYTRYSTMTPAVESWKLYKLWLAKTWFVTKSIELNPFHSSTYVWCDIGNFRNKKEHWRGRNMVSKFIPNLLSTKPSMVFQATKEYFTQPRMPENSPWVHPHDNYISGSIIAGEEKSWIFFYKKLQHSLEEYRRRDIPFIDDQHILLSTCLQNPNLCTFVKYDDTELSPYEVGEHLLDNQSLYEGDQIWWTFQGGSPLTHYGHAYAVFKYVLYHGGDFDLWWPGKDGDAEMVPLE